MLTKDPRVKQPCLHRNLPTIDNRFKRVFSSCLAPRECRIPQAVCKAHFKLILEAGMCPNDFQITLAIEDTPKSKLNECVLVAVPHAVAKEGQGGVYFWNPLTFERMRGWLQQIRRPCFGLWAIPLIVGVSRVECNYMARVSGWQWFATVGYEQLKSEGKDMSESVTLKLLVQFHVWSTRGRKDSISSEQRSTAHLYVT